MPRRDALDFRRLSNSHRGRGNRPDRTNVAHRELSRSVNRYAGVTYFDRGSTTRRPKCRYHTHHRLLPAENDARRVPRRRRRARRQTTRVRRARIHRRVYQHAIVIAVHVRYLARHSRGRDPVPPIFVLVLANHRHAPRLLPESAAAHREAHDVPDVRLARVSGSNHHRLWRRSCHENLRDASHARRTRRAHCEVDNRESRSAHRKRARQNISRRVARGDGVASRGG